MDLLRMIVGWLDYWLPIPRAAELQFSEPSEGLRDCTHGNEPGPFVIEVLGFDLELKHSSICRNCTRTYLNENSRFCIACERPIFPNSEVGRTECETILHLECCPSKSCFCGIWDDGRLKTLHELQPNLFAKGTGTVAEHQLIAWDVRSAIPN